MATDQQQNEKKQSEPGSGKEAVVQYFYRIRFREKGQEFTASTSLDDLQRGDVVMVRGEYGLEPAGIIRMIPYFKLGK